MKKLVLAAILVALAPAVRAQTTTIKLGTLAPIGSSWHEILKQMAQRWEQASNGAVKLRIYAGGAQGSESDMVRKIGIGQLQAAAITNVGMHDVIPEPQAMSVPFLIPEQQLECTFEKVRPSLEAALEKRNLVALQWSRVGGIKLFCTEPRPTPAAMRDARVWAWEGDPRSVEAFRAAGFRPVVLSATEIVSSLQTGMIDCVPTVPLYALTARQHDKADNMMEVTWGYMMGATVVRKDVWEKIAPDTRTKLLQIARDLGAKVDEEVRRMNDDAVAAMKKQGLNVVPTDAKAWRSAMEKATPIIRGGVVPAPFYDEVVKARDACVAGK